jgi:RHS repeat-associated protein
VRVVFDGSGAVVARHDYEPFGTPVTPIGTDPKIFAHLFHDEESQLEFAQARQLQARTGRFTAPDPVLGDVANPQRLNRYAYALNSPLTYSDPTGLDEQFVNCQLGSYWCPGRIHWDPAYGDKYFDASQYGYQGGEELDRGEEQYATRVAIQFAEQVAQYFATKDAEAQDNIRVGSGGFNVEVKVNGQWEPCSIENGCVKVGVALPGAARIGAEGEALVRSLADIGEKGVFEVAGRKRIADGLLREIISEVKNVSYQPLTQQLRDYIAYAQGAGLRFDLWVRSSTVLSHPLSAAIAQGLINLRTFQWK